MTHYLIIPGLGNSGPAHWQTWFEKNVPDCKRIEQKEWDAPALSDWLTAIDHAVAALDPSTVVLIGHSLGCSTIAHWAKHSGKIIKGAMLVAPSDIEAPVYTFPATGFTPIPLEKIPFKTIVVAVILPIAGAVNTLTSVMPGISMLMPDSAHGKKGFLY